MKLFAEAGLRGTAILGSCLLALAGCSLPAPDGTEAALIARAKDMPPLAPAQGRAAKDVVRNGLLLHPDVRAAASSVAASADQVRVQRGALFPALGMTVGGGTGSAGDGDPAVRMNVSQLLMDFGKTKRAVTSADMDLQINYITFQKAVDDAVIELLEAYDAVRMNTEALAVYKRQLAAMTELQKLVSERVEIGATTAPDLLETQKRVQNAAFLVQDAELALADAREQLERRSGQSAGGAVPEFRGGCALRGETDKMRIARLKMAKAEIDLEQAQKARVPKITVSPLARLGTGDTSTGFGLNLGVSSDLLEGGALTARASVARNARDAAEAALDSAERDASLSSRKALRNITAGARRQEMLKRQIELLAKTRELYRSQYFDLGKRSISDLLDNEEEFYTRQAELVELSSKMATNRLSCAVYTRALRGSMELAGQTLYNLPLDADNL